MRNLAIRGRHVRFSIRPDRLRVFLLPEGRAHLREVRAAPRQHGHRQEPNDRELFEELIEDFLCNGWLVVWPEQAGDLRDENWLVISQDYAWVDPNADKELIVGTAYSYDQYAIQSYIDPLVRLGYVDFRRHDYLTPADFDYAVARLRPDFFEYEADRERVLRAGERREEVAMLEAAGQGRLPLEWS